MCLTWTFLIQTLKRLSTACSEVSESGSNDNARLTPKALLKHPEICKIMVTLHCVFPEYLLPALDLLDRDAITRLGLEEARPATLGPASEHRESPALPTGPEFAFGPCDIYCVATSSAVNSDRGAGRDVTGRNHQVILRAWNCSCPTFTLNTLAQDAQPNRGDMTNNEEGLSGEGRDDDIQLSSLSNGLILTDLPLCKHVLACALVGICPMLYRSNTMPTVYGAEKAAWEAGWIQTFRRVQT